MGESNGLCLSSQRNDFTVATKSSNISNSFPDTHSSSFRPGGLGTQHWSTCYVMNQFSFQLRVCVPTFWLQLCRAACYGTHYPTCCLAAWSVTGNLSKVRAVGMRLSLQCWPGEVIPLKGSIISAGKPLIAGQSWGMSIHFHLNGDIGVLQSLLILGK